jgi:hypothetical protein
MIWIRTIFQGFKKLQKKVQNVVMFIGTLHRVPVPVFDNIICSMATRCPRRIRIRQDYGSADLDPNKIMDPQHGYLSHNSVEFKVFLNFLLDRELRTSLNDRIHFITFFLRTLYLCFLVMYYSKILGVRW